jgi:acetyltransferase-like isoleucine patch superfamily enzyme
MFTVARFRALLWSIVMDSVGNRTTIMRHAWIIGADKIRLGDRVTININSILDGSGGLTIGNDVLIAPYVTIMTTEHEINGTLGNYSIGTDKRMPVIIHDGAWIGKGATIMPGVTIGAHSIVGAHSLVLHSVPAYTVVAGVPAKKLRNVK